MRMASTPFPPPTHGRGGAAVGGYGEETQRFPIAENTYTAERGQSQINNY